MENKEQPQVHNDKITENVLNKIRTGEIQMQPKIYFVGKIILLAIVATLVLILTSLVFSFILFSINVSGRLLLLGFGRQGFLAFLGLFPWLPLIIDIFLLFLLEQLVKRFKFGYRSSFAYITISSIALIVFLAFLINVSPLNTILMRRAQEHELPVIGGIYEHVRRPPEDRGLFRGYIDSISTSTREITVYPDDERATSTLMRILVPQQFLMNNFLHIGDYIFVAGKVTNNHIEAFGIKRFTPATTTDSD